MGTLKTVQDILSLGTIMGVWAHPDDEVLNAAGTLMTAVQNGQRVVCVTATRGEGGVQDESRWPAEHLAEIRTAELQDAYAVLGIKEHHWLNYKDGLCEANDEAGIEQIKNLIGKYQPDTILTFGPDGMTGHPDHRAVCNWAVEACEKLTKRPKIYHIAHTRAQYEDGLEVLDKKMNLFFNLEEPNLIAEESCVIVYKLTPELQAIKCRALAAMPSQYANLFGMSTKEEICRGLATEAFTRNEEPQ